MGNKGDKLSLASTKTVHRLMEKLSPIEGITSKTMFGGNGIFHDGKMFCIIDSKGEIFFKVNDTNKMDFESRGSHRHSKMPYFSIPMDIFEDDETFLDWVDKSIAISKG